MSAAAGSSRPRCSDAPFVVVVDLLGSCPFSTMAAQALVSDERAVRRPPLAPSFSAGDGGAWVQPFFDADGNGWESPPVVAPFGFAPVSFATFGTANEALAAMRDGVAIWNDEGGAAVRLRETAACSTPRPI